MKPSAFPFLDASRVLPLVDHELELLEPDTRLVDAVLAACHHPLTRRDMPSQAQTTRDNLLTFLSQNPRGHTAPDALRGIAPGYTFWMRIRPCGGYSPSADGLIPSNPGHAPPPAGTIAGSISLRIGHSPNLDFYLGHIGYHVLPPARGHHYAERACRLLLPLARTHEHKTLWITCNPENSASRRTCERLGAKLVETVFVPRDNPLYAQGDRQKCRYRLEL
ncbi:MAG TPA: GNAT family N-acetyltransferase [Phycisphaerae bacterium]|nr:GNAT family N-acetyltransferase [Phycisphaerae bacterium]